MIAPDRPDTRLVRQVAAYLCRMDARHPAPLPHLIDPWLRHRCHLRYGMVPTGFGPGGASGGARPLSFEVSRIVASRAV